MIEDEIALLLDRLIRHAHSGLHQRAALLHEGGMQPTDGMLLIALADIEPAPIHELVDVLARHKSRVTRTVQKLEAKGLIDRSDAPNDARVKVLRLTPEGRLAANALRSAVVQTLNELLAPLSKEDRNSLRELLGKTLNRR